MNGRSNLSFALPADPVLPWAAAFLLSGNDGGVFPFLCLTESHFTQPQQQCHFPIAFSFCERGETKASESSTSSLHGVSFSLKGVKSSSANSTGAHQISSVQATYLRHTSLDSQISNLFLP